MDELSTSMRNPLVRTSLEGEAFLPELNLKEACDTDIIREVGKIIPLGADYQIHVVTKIHPEEIDGDHKTTNFKIKEITLSWKFVNKVVYSVLKFFVSFGYFPNEGQRSECREALIKRVITGLSPDALEAATKQELERGKREIIATYKKGVEIVINVSTNRERFWIDFKYDGIVRASFSRGYRLSRLIFDDVTNYLSRGKSMTPKIYNLLDRVDAIKDAFDSAEDLLPFQIPPLTKVDEKRGRFRKKEAVRRKDIFWAYSNKFFIVFGEGGKGPLVDARMDKAAQIEKEQTEEKAEKTDREKQVEAAQATIEKLNEINTVIMKFLRERRTDGQEAPDGKQNVRKGSALEKMNAYIERINGLVVSVGLLGTRSVQKLQWSDFFERCTQIEGVPNLARKFFELRVLSSEEMSSEEVEDWAKRLNAAKVFFFEHIAEIIRRLDMGAYLFRLNSELQYLRKDVHVMAKGLELVRDCATELLQSQRAVTERNVEEREKKRREAALAGLDRVIEEITEAMAPHLDGANEVIASAEAAAAEAAHAAAVAKAEAELEEEARETQAAQEAFAILEREAAAADARVESSFVLLGQ